MLPGSGKERGESKNSFFVSLSFVLNVSKISLPLLPVFFSLRKFSSPFIGQSYLYHLFPPHFFFSCIPAGFLESAPLFLSFSPSFASSSHFLSFSPSFLSSCLFLSFPSFYFSFVSLILVCFLLIFIVEGSHVL